MKKFFPLIICLLLLQMPLQAQGSTLIFSDDFEDYDLGEDIVTNPLWDNCDPATLDHFIVVDDGSDQSICGLVAWSNGAECKYMVMMYKLLADGSAQIDFKMDSQEVCMVELILRFDGAYPSSWECYHGSLLTGIDKDMALMSISYVHNGTAETLEEYMLYDFDIASWHTLNFTTTGDSVVNLTLVLDEEEELSTTDDPGRISFGDCILGLTCSAIVGSWEFMLDNYQLYSVTTHIQPRSLGKLKCLFQ